MFKIGNFYLTKTGQLVKLFNTFPFQDGYTINAAIYMTGGGWTAVRFTPAGQCNVDDGNNRIFLTETFDMYRRYMQFVVWCDRATNTWRGQAKDPRGQTIVSLDNIENHERAMQLIQTGAEQKLLTWMREAGYDDEMKETIRG